MAETVNPVRANVTQAKPSVTARVAAWLRKPSAAYWILLVILLVGGLPASEPSQLGRRHAHPPGRALPDHGE